MNLTVGIAVITLALVINFAFWKSNKEIKNNNYRDLTVFNNLAILSLVVYYSIDLVALYWLAPVFAFSIYANIKNSGICEECGAYIHKKWKDSEFNCKKCAIKG